MAQPNKKLSWYFKIMGITGKKLHKTTKIALRTCYSIIRGERFPSPKNLKKIHKYYPQISLSYLFSENYECQQLHKKKH